MVAFTLRSACASLCDIFNFDTENYRLLIRPLRNHSLQNHLWSSGYTSASHTECRQLDPGQVYHLTKSHTHTSDSKLAGLRRNTNKKKLSKFENELNSQIITEWTALNPQTYAYGYQKLNRKLEGNKTYISAFIKGCHCSGRKRFRPPTPHGNKETK